MSRQTTAVFIASSDNTYDVFGQVSQSFLKNWTDCPYDIYVGLNSARPLPAGWKAVCAPVCGWRNELAIQLEAIDCKNIILFLDDFLIIDRVDQQILDRLLEVVHAENLQYLRLKPQDSSLVSALSRRLFVNEFKRGIVALRKSTPYYSALQVAIWNKDHLCTLLKLCRDIWAFEHISSFPEAHHAVCDRAVIDYRHVVEKGAWQVTAGMEFSKAGLSFTPGTRIRRPWTDWVRLVFGRVTFALWGYSSLRLRKLLRKGSS